MSPCGYHGRYLLIDLTLRSGSVGTLEEHVLRQYIGGGGLGTWLLQQHSTPNQDPLAPAAAVAFVFSPLVGSPLTTSAKFAVVAQSPLTFRINDSLSSSHFAIAGKRTGYDAIVIIGAAAEPTSVVITPDDVRFLPATDLWGLPARTAGEQLRETLGPGFRVAAIGPAGERLVRYATVSHDGRHAGRGGLGAVLGSKQLKAVAVAGDRLTTSAHPAGLAAYAKNLSRLSLGEGTEKYRELGTVSNLATFNRLGTLPTRNFQMGEFEGAERLTPEALTRDFTRTRESCAACTIGCEHIFQLKGLGPLPVAAHDADTNIQVQSPGAAVRLEYENLFALGPLCGISDPDVVLRASALCDELGIDTISAGVSVAFAMECAERGWLDAPHLRFSDGPALLSTLREIGEQRGLGVLLGRGVRFAASQIGHGAESIAPHVKGLEIPGYEPRALQMMGLGFAVGTRGADHNRSGAYQVDFSTKVDRLAGDIAGVPLAIETENEAAIMDSLILCKFLRGVFPDKLAAMAEMLSLITGWDVSSDELSVTASRIVTAKKRFNISQGWTPAEDTLPDRFLDDPLGAGASAGARLSRERLAGLIKEYNRLRGWSDEGWVSSEGSSDDLGDAISKRLYSPRGPD